MLPWFRKNQKNTGWNVIFAAGAAPQLATAATPYCCVESWELNVTAAGHAELLPAKPAGEVAVIEKLELPDTGWT